MAAEYIIQKLGEKVKVAELEGIPGASATRERGEGFHKVADQKLTVVAKQSADFDRSKGLTVAENMLQANPDTRLFSLKMTKWHWALSKQPKVLTKKSLSLALTAPKTA